ncbi:MAG: type II secretion system F family protein [Gammaproteobacteria bacterium]|nr:MAG: type II secretion system F family protein [Gammaproteobacteria bacterium]
MAETASNKTIFLWTGKDRKGAATKGEIEAANVAAVRAQLRSRGILVKSVRKKRQKGSAMGKKTRIPAKEIAIFSRQMATMIAAGVPIVEAIDMIASGHDNPGMRHMLNQIKADIESGSTFTDALRKFPLQFDRLYCSLVEAGEQAGILETLMNEIAVYQEKIESVKAKIKKALFYPIAVIAVALVVTFILMIFVIPQFEELFKGFGGDLPAFTLLVLDISAVVQDKWWLILLAIGGSIYAFIQAKKRSEAFANLVDKTLLNFPVIGDLLRKATVARFSRTLGTMFAAGVPLVDALQSVSSAAGNVVYSNAILKMKDEVSVGMPMNVAMAQTKLFPHMVVQMLRVGEQTGAIDTMLGKVADFYEEEVDTAVESMSSLMEPFILVVLGGLIGSLVVAMYLPIFKLGSVV